MKSMAKRGIVRTTKNRNVQQHCATCPAHSGLEQAVKNLKGWNKAQDNIADKMKEEITGEVKDLKKCLNDRMEEDKKIASSNFNAIIGDLSSLKYWIIGLLVAVVLILVGVLIQLLIDVEEVVCIAMLL